MRSGETGYVLCALALCVVLVGAHVSGSQLEQVERQDRWAALAAGRDVIEDPLAGAAPGRDIVSAAQIPSDRDVAPAALPTWVQAVRSSRLWALASIAEAFGLKGEELIRLNGLDTRGHLLVGQLLQVSGARDVGRAEGPGPLRVREISPGWISAEHAVVIDADSGQILWAREANVPVPPASLTKILTAMLVFDHANLRDPVTVQVDSRRMPGSTVMGLHPGETLTVEDLLYGMMLASGNDAALALAHHVAGTAEAFAELMNEKVRSLGLTGSHFANPHGLDAPGHVSTALDMAMLAREAMGVPLFRELSAAREYETPRGRGYVVYNLNQLLWRYQGADGVKIGYTPAAGRAIVASATRDGRRVYVAMMRSNDIYVDSAALLDWAFASYSWQ